MATTDTCNSEPTLDELKKMTDDQLRVLGYARCTKDRCNMICKVEDMTMTMRGRRCHDCTPPNIES